MANLSKAGIAAGVTEISLFLEYARKDTAIAINPTSIKAVGDRPIVFCFSNT